MKKLGFYVHIPFCEHKCTYCDFNSGYALEELNYLSALLSEIEFSSHTFENHEIDTIFFGGGTPSLYSPQNLEKILKLIFKKFKVNQSCEITIECNPNSLSLEKVKSFKKIGFNRISLGAQSFDPHQLKTLTRVHSREHIFNSIEFIKKARFSNFNIDLMFGLPHQSLNQFKTDLETALSLGPTHISFYNLTLAKKHPLFSKLPNDEKCRDFFLLGQNILQRNGFLHYEVSNYACPGFECRHNLKYWNMEEYVGVGAGACSYLETKPKWHPAQIIDGKYFRLSNIKTPDMYIQSLKNHQHACHEFENLTDNKALIDYLIGRLRLPIPLPLSIWHERFGITVTHDHEKLFAKYEALGFLKRELQEITLSPQGQLFIDEILIDFVNLYPDS